MLPFWDGSCGSHRKFHFSFIPRHICWRNFTAGRCYLSLVRSSRVYISLMSELNAPPSPLPLWWVLLFAMGRNVRKSEGGVTPSIENAEEGAVEYWMWWDIVCLSGLWKLLADQTISPQVLVALLNSMIDSCDKVSVYCALLYYIVMLYKIIVNSSGVGCHSKQSGVKP